MADIFISYATEDRERVVPLVRALERQHWSVWWDRTILPGKNWEEVIEQALASARCVIVLWSQASVASDWVRIEAGEARDRGILVPALLDEVKIPLAFRRIQAARLLKWRGTDDEPVFQELCQAIREKIPRGTQGSEDRARSAAASVGTGAATHTAPRPPRTAPPPEPAQPPQPPAVKPGRLTATQKGVLAVAMLVALLRYLLPRSLGFAAQEVAGSFHIAQSELAGLFSALLYTGAAAALLWGWMADRNGPRRTLAGGLMLAAGALVAGSLTASLTALEAAVVVLGLAHAAITPVLSKVIAGFPESRRGIGNALLELGSMLAGPLVMAASNGLVIASWRSYCGVLAASSVMAGLLWLAIFRGAALPGTHRAAAVRSPQLPTAIAVIAAFACWSCCLNWLSRSHPQERFLLPVLAIAGLAAGWAADRAVLRGGSPIRVNRRFAAWGLVGCVCLFPFAQTAAVPLLLALALGTSFPTLWSLSQAAAGARAGTWAGWQVLAATLVGAAFWNWFGLDPAVASIPAAVIAAAGAATLFWLVRDDAHPAPDKIVAS